MPDSFGVYDGMKVWEFLDFFAVAYQIPRSRRKRVLSDVLELLDLTHKRDDFVNGLSRGMKPHFQPHSHRTGRLLHVNRNY
jgi:ABC-2 type transport system ATP-binding protein